VRVEWDEAKRMANVRRHGIDFVGVQELFEGYTVTVEDDRFDYGEPRFVSVGLLEGRVVVVVHTENDETLRIISARKATKNEEQSYFSSIAD
jgi:uncharacterized DUF497 family protein